MYLAFNKTDQIFVGLFGDFNIYNFYYFIFNCEFLLK